MYDSSSPRTAVHYFDLLREAAINLPRFEEAVITGFDMLDVGVIYRGNHLRGVVVSIWYGKCIKCARFGRGGWWLLI